MVERHEEHAGLTPARRLQQLFAESITRVHTASTLVAATSVAWTDASVKHVGPITREAWQKS